MTNIISKPKSKHFKTLTREEKLDALLAFCMEHKRLPRTFKEEVDEEERYLGTFYCNNKSQLNKYALAFPENELKIFKQIEQFVTKRIPRKERLAQILSFCESNKKIPSQVSKDDSERKLGHLMNSFRLMYKNKQMDAEECLLMEKINEYKSGNVKSKKERLMEVLDFCKTNNRTPKQHVDDQSEKRMGEFLTTVKMAHKGNKLDPECIELVKQILMFSSPSREQKLSMLFDFVNINKRTPKMNSDDSTERLLASFFIKAKTQMKSGKVTTDEHNLLTKILGLCEVKSRKEKIEVLLDYCTNLGYIPKLNSNDGEERKHAMFLNNMKQLKRKNKLSDDEVQLIAQIEQLKSVLV